MRSVDLSPSVRSSGDPLRVAALTRHLHARLLDLGPGGPEVLSVDERLGQITVCFPGRSAQSVLSVLSQRFGIQAAQDGTHILFALNDTVPFEDLDYVWGCLFDLLS